VQGLQGKEGYGWFANDKQESDLQESAVGEQDQDDEQEEQDIEGTL
jgi:hypothetical protein